MEHVVNHLRKKNRNFRRNVSDVHIIKGSLNDITDDIYDLEEFVKTITDMGIWLYSLEVGPVPITASHAEDFGC